MKRLFGLVTIGVTLGMLVACATNGSLNTVMLTTGLTGLDSVVVGLEAGLKVIPAGLIPAAQLASYTTDLTTADAALTKAVADLSSATPPTADSVVNTLNAADAVINTVLDVAAGIPLIPQPASGFIQAAAVAAPGVEKIVNNLIATMVPTTATPAAPLTVSAMAPDSPAALQRHAWETSMSPAAAAAKLIEAQQVVGK